jgi:hypothetical protein
MSEQDKGLALENRKLELTQARVAGKKLQFLAAMHESLVGDVAESLGRAAKMRLSGFVQEKAAKALEPFSENSYATLFCAEEFVYAGAVLFSAEFSCRIIAGWFNLRRELSNRALTPLEEGAFWRAAERVTRVFLSAYANSGFREPRVISRGRLRDVGGALANLHEILLFKYNAEMPASACPEPPLCVLLGAEMASRLVAREAQEPRETEESTVARSTWRLPIETAVVLASFSVPLAELEVIKPGDTILLPDPNEAWLGTSGKPRLLPLEVELDGRLARLRLRDPQENTD